MSSEAVFAGSDILLQRGVFLAVFELLGDEVVAVFNFVIHDLAAFLYRNYGGVHKTAVGLEVQGGVALQDFAVQVGSMFTAYFSTRSRPAA